METLKVLLLLFPIVLYLLVPTAHLNTGYTRVYMGIFLAVYQDRRTLPEIFSYGLRCPESAYEHKVDIFFLVYQNGRTLPAIFSDGLR